MNAKSLVESHLAEGKISYKDYAKLWAELSKSQYKFKRKEIWETPWSTEIIIGMWADDASSEKFMQWIYQNVDQPTKVDVSGDASGPDRKQIH